MCFLSINEKNTATESDVEAWAEKNENLPPQEGLTSLMMFFRSSL